VSVLRTVEEYDESEAARAAAARLVESGIGATVDHAPDEGGTTGWVVEVLPEDHVRACEVLGLPVPEPDPEEAEARAKEGRLPWKSILAIWLVAMIVFPVLAFWLTVQLTD
jgi:hypothetical protein